MNGRAIIAQHYADMLNARGRAEARPRSYPASPGGIVGESRAARASGGGGRYAHASSSVGLMLGGATSCVQSRGISLNPQTSVPANPPLKLPQTANLPPMTVVGFRKRHGSCMPTNPEQFCIWLLASAMSACASDTPRAKSGRQLISFGAFSGPTTARDGSTPSWPDARRHGGLKSSERGNLLLLSERRKRGRA